MFSRADIACCSDEVRYEGDVLVALRRKATQAGATITQDVVRLRARTGVCAVPLLTPTRVVLIRQYHVAANTELWTIPMGALPDGIDPQTQMQYELAEEIGYVADHLTLIGRSHVLPGYVANEPAYIFVADGLRPTVRTTPETLTIHVDDFEVSHALRMIVDGAITDARTVAALLLWNHVSAFNQGSAP